MPFKDEIDNPTRLMVKLAGLEVSKDAEGSLCSLPLGACLGVAIYDPIAKVGGMLHSLLPSSSHDPFRAALRPGLFLDTGLNALLDGMRQIGAKRENLRMFAAGAAEMIDESPVLNIGRSNQKMLDGLLERLGLKIHAQALGGKTNCSMEMFLATGLVRLKYSGDSTLKTLCSP